MGTLEADLAGYQAGVDSQADFDYMLDEFTELAAERMVADGEFDGHPIENAVEDYSDSFEAVDCFYNLATAIFHAKEEEMAMQHLKDYVYDAALWFLSKRSVRMAELLVEDMGNE